jgi:D-3-phosphoglycerate dehydrogenase / 2-oxoglutarate reductase
MTKVVATMSITDDELNRLKTHCEVFVTGWGKTGMRLTQLEMKEVVSDADILLLGYENLTEELILNSPNLKIIGCARSNPVNIDIACASKLKIPVLYTPARNAISTAEYTMGIILSETRNIAKSYHAMKSGRFLGDPENDFVGSDLRPDVIWNLDGASPYKEFRGVELSGHTLGLIGLGSIGSRVARLAQAFGMNVVAYSLSKDAEKAEALGVELISLDELLRTSDIVSVHCRVTPETIGLIGNREIELMKPTAYLINTARAVLIDQQALLTALRNKRIAGAALDVFWYEPLPVNHPLLELDNLTITPHLAGSTKEVIQRQSKMIVDDVLAWMEGGIPRFVFNPEVLF